MIDRLERHRRAEILLVEDNDHDVVLTREGFKDTPLVLNLHRVENGEQCLAFLRKAGPYAEAPTPDLVLLDLNMPVMGGREVLDHIVHDEELRHIPVVILTTSSDEGDVLESYRLRCSSYVTKPVDFEQFLGVIKGLGDYWFSLVVTPPADGPPTPATS